MIACFASSLSLSLSLSFFLSLSVYLSLFLSVYIYIYVQNNLAEKLILSAIVDLVEGLGVYIEFYFFKLNIEIYI